MRIFRREQTVSTNLDARGGKPFDVFVADFQTGGRGRLDHRWHSAKGENLTFSAVLPAAPDAAHSATLPLVAGLAVAETLGDGFTVKWPNDVYFGDRKICGILCERDGDNIIVGIGVNVNETAFPPDLADRAVSLRIVFGREFDPDLLLAELLDSLCALHAQWLAHGFAGLLPRFAKRDYLKGKRIDVFNTDSDPHPIGGICNGIAADGSLLVGSVSVYSGEPRPSAN